MVIKDIEKQETKNYLESLGFQKEERTMWGTSKTYYCWYEGRKKVGRETPTIIISGDDGSIKMWMNSSYIMREIPDILITLLSSLTIKK